MKVAYVYSSLATTGGTERMITEKANYFAEKYGYDVTIINCFQHSNEKNILLISSKVKQINLGIPYFSQYNYKYPKRLWVKWKLNKFLRKRVSESVRQINPDILIGVVQFQADLLSNIRCKSIKIFECHEAKTYTIMASGRNRILPMKLYNVFCKKRYFGTIEKNADIIVTLTEKDKLLWNNAKQVEVIPNFSTMSISQYSNCTSKRVIAVGRLEWEKGFERLIEVWTIVSSKFPDWHLDIYGEGGMHDSLIALIKKNKLKNITIHHFVTNISKEYATSSICAVTSYYEGFSLVILEALKHGVPCIAFDCPFGPSSIIEDNCCGFLVNDGDISLFAERLSLLMDEENTRVNFSQAAIERAQLFDTNIIMEKWKCLFEKCIITNY